MVVSVRIFFVYRRITYMHIPHTHIYIYQSDAITISVVVASRLQCPFLPFLSLLIYLYFHLGKKKNSIHKQ